MAVNGRKLRSAFVRKQETQDLLSNLEKLKGDGSVTEEQYEPLRSEYKERLAGIESEIVAIKNDLNTELVNCRKDLGVYKVEIDRLGTRHEVGEIPLDKYRSLDQKLRRRIERIESRISLLETLTSANIFG